MKARELRAWRQPQTLWLNILLLAYGVMWAGGIGHYVLIGQPPLDTPWAASVFLLLAGVIVLATSARRDWLSLILAATLGFAAEIHGVKYGVIFSPYVYTAVLQPQIAGMPLVMFSAWLVLLAYVRRILAPWRVAGWLEVILSSTWMTAIDLVIDPLAANQLGYWRWAQSGWYYGIPLHNFAGWFVVSVLIFTLIRQDWQTNPWAQCVGLSITLFFTAIALSYGLWLAGAVGLGLCGLHCYMHRRAQSHTQNAETYS
jgi:uncharacterized membrane protein